MDFRRKEDSLTGYYSQHIIVKNRKESAVMSVPYSSKIFGLVPWYSFLIVTGAAIAIILAVREERRTELKKDTVIDFALWVLPAGIIGARLYYVIFSWKDFKDDLLSVFRIWEGGIAIYGAVIAGILTAFIFSRKRKISFLTLCDMIAPGLILAQAIGRWGNYFNQECYGLIVENPSLQFFPFAVQIPGGNGLEWHMATFFYESVWNLIVFVFLMIARRKWFRYRGDVISFYAFCYACGRLIIEDFRTDSLYASSSIRISQLLSVLICLFLLLRYFLLFRKRSAVFSLPACIIGVIAAAADFFLIVWLSGLVTLSAAVWIRFVVLLGGSMINLLALFVLYSTCAEGEIIYAGVKG